MNNLKVYSFLLFLSQDMNVKFTLRERPVQIERPLAIRRNPIMIARTCQNSFDPKKMKKTPKKTRMIAQSFSKIVTIIVLYIQKS